MGERKSRARLRQRKTPKFVPLISRQGSELVEWTRQRTLLKMQSLHHPISQSWITGFSSVTRRRGENFSSASRERPRHLPSGREFLGSTIPKPLPSHQVRRREQSKPFGFNSRSTARIINWNSIRE